jgi:2-dehydropantoate 2-reductase
MKIAVVGTGAMGSVYAGLLADAGNEVWAVDVNAAHIDAIRARGLQVEGASGDRVVHISATTEPAEVGQAELVVIATKAMDAETAARSARLLLGPETVVIATQNGLGAADAVVDVLGEERVMIAVAGGFGASLLAPGHVHHHGFELLRLGERHGPVRPRTERIAAVWRAAGFNVKTFDDVDRLVWEKLICNACYSGTCALLELTIGEVINDPHGWSVASRCSEEALEVARAIGISLDVEDAASYARAFGLTIPAARPSVLLDLLAGRPCEIEWINGAIPRVGRQVGIAAPTNEAVTALVLAKQGARRSESR